MRAAIFHGTGRPLTIEQVATPAPRPGEVLVRVAACGVCHTDLHYVDHGTPTFKAPPIILGHEIAGTIAAVAGGGENGDNGNHNGRGFVVGDRVLIPAVLTCGHCAMCRAGRENICEHSVMLGNNIDGGFAEYVRVPAKDLHRLPDNLPLEESAIIADAMTTPYHAAVRRARVTPGDWVVVFGCGGVGLSLVQVVAAIGGRVIAVDIADSKLERACQMGAEAIVNPRRTDRLDKAVRRITGGIGADIALEAIGKAETQEQAFACLRTGGRLVLVGYSTEALSLNAARVMFREIDVLGSLGCRPVDYPRVIDMASRGKLRVGELVTHRFPLEAIDEAFAVLRAGESIRAIVTP
jgi:6-hydroxycyclohex-1-ene-1-carbonyl-CoA dehydrogenase